MYVSITQYSIEINDEVKFHFFICFWYWKIVPDSAKKSFLSIPFFPMDYSNRKDRKRIVFRLRSCEYWIFYLYLTRFIDLKRFFRFYQEVRHFVSIATFAISMKNVKSVNCFFFADSLIRANKYGKRNKKQNPIISINQIFIENDNNKRNGKTRKSIIFVKI